MPRAIFDALPVQDEIQELTTLMDQLGGDMSRVITPLLQNGAEGLSQAYTLLAQKAINLFTTAPEKDIESSFNLVLSIFQNASPAQFRELLLELLKTLEAYDGPRDLYALRIMSNIFNSLEIDNALRYDVFLAISRAAAKRSRLSLVAPLISNLPAWTAAWKLAVEDRRALYKLLANEFYKNNQHDAFVQTLVLFIGDSTDEKAKADVVSSLLQFMTAASVFTTEPVAALPAVANLKGHWMHSLLNVFQSGTLADYDKFYAALPAGTLTEADHQTLRRKVRLLTLAALAADHLNGEVPYAAVATALQVSPAEVEASVIDAIQFKLVDAQLDQLKQVVRITRTTYRAFGAPEWSKLGARLAEWSQSVTEVLAVVRNARLISAQTTA